MIPSLSLLSVPTAGPMCVRMCRATGSPAPPPRRASSRRVLAAAGTPPGSQHGLLVMGSRPPRAARGRTAGCTASDAPQREGKSWLTSRQAMACEGSGRTDRTNRSGRHCSAGVGLASRWWAHDMVVRSLRRHGTAITAKHTPMSRETRCRPGRLLARGRWSGCKGDPDLLGRVVHPHGDVHHPDGVGSVSKRWRSSHGPACVQRATPCCAPRDDYTRPTVPPLRSSRSACRGMRGQECTATFLRRSQFSRAWSAAGQRRRRWNACVRRS